MEPNVNDNDNYVVWWTSDQLQALNNSAQWYQLVSWSKNIDKPLVNNIQVTKDINMSPVNDVLAGMQKPSEDCKMSKENH